MAYVAAGRCDGFWQRNLNYWDIAAGIIFWSKNLVVLLQILMEEMSILKMKQF